jgi:hypothetical protein
MEACSCTNVAVETQWVLQNLDVCYPACNAHWPYCRLWPAPFYNISPHYLINGRIKKKKRDYLTLNVFWFSLQNFVWNISHSKQKWTRYDQKCMSVITKSTLYSCSILMKLTFSRQIYRKNSSNIKFQENLSSGSRVVAYGRTDKTWRS